MNNPDLEARLGAPRAKHNIQRSSRGLIVFVVELSSKAQIHSKPFLNGNHTILAIFSVCYSSDASTFPITEDFKQLKFLCQGLLPASRGIPRISHPHKFGYLRMWGCIPIYWGTPVYGDASLYMGVPQYMGICIPIQWGTPVYGDMHPHTLGHPSIWGCIPMYWGTPIYGDASPYIVVS
jgi:hypothetical protein